MASLTKMWSPSPKRHPLTIHSSNEYDFDRLVFHVNSCPLFRLDHLLNANQFMEWIGFDHYDHRACTSSTPLEYRYCWNASSAIVADIALELYKSQVVDASVVLSDLFSVPEHMSDKETVGPSLRSQALICTGAFSCMVPVRHRH